MVLERNLKQFELDCVDSKIINTQQGQGVHNCIAGRISVDPVSPASVTLRVEAVCHNSPFMHLLIV